MISRFSVETSLTLAHRAVGEDIGMTWLYQLNRYSISGNRKSRKWKRRGHYRIRNFLSGFGIRGINIYQLTRRLFWSERDSWYGVSLFLSLRCLSRACAPWRMWENRPKPSQWRRIHKFPLLFLVSSPPPCILEILRPSYLLFHPPLLLKAKTSFFAETGEPRL